MLDNYLQHTRTTTVIPLTGQKLNYWDEHRPNTHTNLKRHGTVQTVIRLLTYYIHFEINGISCNLIG